MDRDQNDAEAAVAVAAVWARLEPAITRYRAQQPPRRARWSTTRRVVVAGLVAGIAGAGGVAIARSNLGDPAPPAIRTSMSSIDDGMPTDLRYDPDIADARSVAHDGDAILYAADLVDGGVCTELAVAGEPAGATCRPANTAPLPIEASIPGTPEDTGKVVIGGRINVDADQVAVIVDGDRRIPIAVEGGGYYVIALDDAQSAAARRALAIEATKGPTVVAALDLSTAFDAEPIDQPISVEMTTGSGDLSTLASIHGTINVPGAVTVLLRFPDGTSTDPVSLNAGRYELVLPADRQGDLADQPGRLIVLDAHGQQLASRPVAAVSWWRAHEHG